MGNAWLGILGALVSGGALTAVITHWFRRRQAGAETSDLNVRTALALEERAILRYNSALEALAAAQLALDAARADLHEQELYILELHKLLEGAGIALPVPRSNSRV